MAYIYKPTRKRTLSDGTVEHYKSPKWYAVWKDARDGRRKSCPAYTDEKASIHLAHRKERESAQAAEGLLVPDAERVPLLEHLERWRSNKLDSGMTAKHAGESFVKLRKLFEGCGWTRLPQLSALEASRWLAKQRSRPRFSAQTFNHYVATLRGFSRWAVRHGILAADPFVAMDRLPAGLEPKHVRRVLGPKEFAQLLQAAESGPRYQNSLTGPARAMLYTMAAYTGLRARELAMLTREAFAMGSNPPRVTISVGEAKNRRLAELPIHAELKRRLVPFLAQVGAGPVFPGRWLGEQARMLRRDLKAAGIPYKTPHGVFDFHALRSLYVTNLALAGVSPQEAARLARHSDPRLTLKVYTRLGLSDLAAAVNKLPAPRQLERARKPRKNPGPPGTT